MPPFPPNTQVIGNYLKQQLTKTLDRIYTVNYTDYWGLNPALNFHTAIADLPLGMDTIEAFFKADAGQMAALYDGTGDDIPTVDFALGKQSVPCAVFVQGADWNTLQIEKQRVAEASNTDIPTLNVVSTKQDIVADYFNRREHHTVLYGYPKVGIRGIFNLAGITKSDATWQPYKKASGAYTESTETLYESMVDLIYAFMSRARLSSPSQVLMKIPPLLSRRLVEIYKTSSGQTVGGMTIRQMLQSSELGLGIGGIDTHNELQGSELNKNIWNESGTGAYAATTDRIIFKSSSYNLERHYFARKPYPQFQRNTMTWEQVTIGSSSGIMNFEPEKVWYYDFSNALV